MCVETKRSEKLAGWLLLLPLVVAFWLFTFGLAILFVSAFANTAHRNSFGENLFIIVAVSLVAGLLGFISHIFTRNLHDALASTSSANTALLKSRLFTNKKPDGRKLQVGRYLSTTKLGGC